jgi:hypothetical protein
MMNLKEYKFHIYISYMLLVVHIRIKVTPVLNFTPLSHKQKPIWLVFISTQDGGEWLVTHVALLLQKEHWLLIA